MEPTGPPNTQGTSSPGNLIAKQKQDALQAAVQSSGDGGVWSQLSGNPFFTAVGRALVHQTLILPLSTVIAMDSTY